MQKNEQPLDFTAPWESLAALRSTLRIAMPRSDVDAEDEELPAADSVPLVPKLDLSNCQQEQLEGILEAALNNLFGWLGNSYSTQGGELSGLKWGYFGP